METETEKINKEREFLPKQILEMQKELHAVKVSLAYMCDSAVLWDPIIMS
jgi:hypothetical protein